MGSKLASAKKDIEVDLCEFVIEEEVLLLKVLKMLDFDFGKLFFGRDCLMID